VTPSDHGAAAAPPKRAAVHRAQRLRLEGALHLIGDGL
jgi:hypothetical protein